MQMASCRHAFERRKPADELTSVCGPLIVEVSETCMRRHLDMPIITIQALFHSQVMVVWASLGEQQTCR